jgi:hypothetical protein
MEQLELEWSQRDRRAPPRYELEVAERQRLVKLIAEAVVAVFKAAQEARDERQNGTEQSH